MTPSSQARTTTKLPHPSISATPYGQPMAAGASRKSIAELTTPRKAYQEQALRLSQSHKDYGAKCIETNIRHPRKEKEDGINPPQRQGTHIDVRMIANDFQQASANKIYQDPGLGTNAGNAIAASPKTAVDRAPPAATSPGGIRRLFVASPFQQMNWVRR